MSDRVTPADAALKTYTRVVIDACGGLEAAAAVLRGRVGKSQLANYQSPHNDAFVPVDVLIRLIEVTRDPCLLEEVARRAGYRLEPLGSVSPGCAMRVVAAVQGEVTQALQALSEGMADGVVDDADRARVQGELLDVARVASEGAAAMGRAGE